MLKAAEFGPRLTNIDLLEGRKRDSFAEIRDDLFWTCYDKSKHFSMVHITGFYNIYQSIRYISKNKLPGDIIECGCFLGGCGIFAGLLLDALNDSGRTIYLFDSFEGFPAGEVDYILGKQVKSSRYQNTEQHVRENIAFARPGSTNITLVPGFVEDTLPKFESGPIALLRLDTDFYNSTKVEFDILYDRLVPGGVLIVDDYGLFDGSRTATDEFLAGLDNAPLLNRIDKGVWSGVKPG